MQRILAGLFVLALFATPALAQKVTIDYAHDFDFEKVKTFKYEDTGETNAGELMDPRIRDAIIRELVEGGLEQVESDPDIHVTYHISTQEQTVFNTTNFGYGGWHGGWGGWGGVGVGTSTTTASTYTLGTLVLDAYDHEEKKLIWRGTGTVTLKEKPEKQMTQVDKILTKIGSRWDKILHNQGK